MYNIREYLILKKSLEKILAAILHMQNANVQKVGSE